MGYLIHRSRIAARKLIRARALSAGWIVLATILSTSSSWGVSGVAPSRQPADQGEAAIRAAKREGARIGRELRTTSTHFLATVNEISFEIQGKTAPTDAAALRAVPKDAFAEFLATTGPGGKTWESFIDEQEATDPTLSEKVRSAFFEALTKADGEAGKTDTAESACAESFKIGQRAATNYCVDRVIEYLRNEKSGEPTGTCKAIHRHQAVAKIPYCAEMGAHSVLDSYRAGSTREQHCLEIAKPFLEARLPFLVASVGEMARVAASGRKPTYGDEACVYPPEPTSNRSAY